MSAGKVVTVRGPVEPDQLGITLSHEHFLLRLDNWFVAPRSEDDRAFAYSRSMSPQRPSTSHTRWRSCPCSGRWPTVV